jgi:ribosomal protein S27E
VGCLCLIVLLAVGIATIFLIVAIITYINTKTESEQQRQEREEDESYRRRRKRKEIEVRCPNCDEEYTCPESISGTKFFCSACGQKILIPPDNPPKPSNKTMLGRTDDWSNLDE